jgi:hypothetical protein
MTDEGDTTPGRPDKAETPAQRRRRLARVFGDVLPEQTSDDRAETPPEPGNDGEAWLRAQVPPHHG